MAVLGAFVLYCKLKTEGRVVIQFLDHVVPTWTSPYKPLFETLLFSLVGGVVAVVLTEPESVAQGLAGGLGVAGIVAAFTPQKT